MSYTGPDAQEAFERDFQMYAGKLAAGPFQVFGVNMDVPTVLFYNEYQPLANFLGSLGFWGKCYLKTLRVMQFGNCCDNKIWLDPKKGELCQGPEGPDCEIHGELFGGHGLGGVPCSAELLQDDSCLRFLASCKSKEVDQWIMELIVDEYSLGVSLEVPEVHQPAIFSMSTNATIAVGGGVWREGWECGEREVMENGATRFMLEDEVGWFLLWTHWLEECKVWISQALSIFHKCGVSLDDNLSQYELIFSSLHLVGHLSASETTCQQRHEKTIYLFVCPLSPSTPTKRCATSSLHYWSFDPTGQHPLPAEICQDLGLPTELFFKVESLHGFHWTNEAYKWMHEYQLARGFGPKTPDFARHLGYPFYQVQNDSDHFKDISVTMASPAQSPAILTLSEPHNCSSAPPLPNTHFSPLQHTVSIPFDNQIPYSGTSTTAPITPFYSRTSPVDFDFSSGGFPISTYPNDHTGWNANLLWSDPSYGQSIPPPVPLLGPPAACPLPSFTYPNTSKELQGWNITDTSFLKCKERDKFNHEDIAGNSRKCARLFETCKSGAVPHLWPAQDSSLGRLENDGVAALQQTKSYTLSWGMGGSAMQTSSLEEEVRWLREENERLRGLFSTSTSSSNGAV
ncbi:hypothetical protein V5O48_017166 [Marasmius crinis-equi]|uniref:Uncharacterized protein n=1 Tax=Marasmius crinis-equi TaxID=585013 RepID=A0ABR3EPR1_9AGAR